MLIKDTVIVTDSENLLTINLADTIDKLKCIVTKHNTHNVIDLAGAGVTAGDISRILSVIDNKYESHVNSGNKGMDIESDELMECDIPCDNKLEAQSEVVNMKGDKLLHTEPNISDFVGPVDYRA